MGSNEVGHVSSRVEPRVNPVPVMLRAFLNFRAQMAEARLSALIGKSNIKPQLGKKQNTQGVKK